MVKCSICGKEYKNIQPLSKHITSYHNLDKRLYYDKYMKQPNEGICLVCNGPTNFYGMDRGYNTYCCRRCQVIAQNNFSKVDHLDQWETKHQHIKQYETLHNCTNIKTLYDLYGYKVGSAIYNLHIPVIKESKMYQYVENKYIEEIVKYINDKNTVKQRNNSKIKHDSHWNNPDKNKQTVQLKNDQFEKDHNCTQVKTLISKYGQGWRALQLPTITRNHNSHFISNVYLDTIKDYSSSYHASNKEKYIYDEISKIYKGRILHNTKRIISPNELDIYIPAIKLAIEYNGLFWHSTKHISDKDYHLNKSVECRKLGIRLIHVYEFENIDTQLTKIISLIHGVDLFNKNDFNKNNLESDIPNSEIIYKDENYTIYGPGPLRTD